MAVLPCSLTSTLLVAFILVLTTGYRVSAQNVTEDFAAITACIDLAKKNAEAKKQDKDEQPGAEGRLQAAQDEAKSDPESCIGVVVFPCLKKVETPGESIECYTRGTKAWEKRMDEKYKQLLDVADKNVANSFRISQKAWLHHRDASCKATALTFGKGGTAESFGEGCIWKMIAHRAIWLEAASHW